MVGRAAPLLSRRLGSAVALAGALVAYYLARDSMPNISDGWDRALLSCVLIPAMFGLVLLALPIRRARGLGLVGIALGIFALVLDNGDFNLAANFAKLGAMTALGFAFLELFENVGWVVLVAALIPWVDAYSVWRGPTKTIVEEQAELFSTLSIAFPVPGEHGSANLGLPDVLFFALFLSAASRFGLRVGWTWLGLVASFGTTLMAATVLDVKGLPALPLLSLGFLAPNADLIWHQLRGRDRRRARARASPSESRSGPPPAGAG